MRVSSERPSTHYPSGHYADYNSFDNAFEAAATLPTNPGFNAATPITQSITPRTSNAPGVSGPPPVMDINYIPGYLASNIGKTVRAEFVVGQNIMTDRVGVIKDVGVNYFILHDPLANTDFMADLYSVKFITLFNNL